MKVDSCLASVQLLAETEDVMQVLLRANPDPRPRPPPSHLRPDAQVVVGTAMGCVYLVSMRQTGGSSAKLLQESHGAPVTSVAYSPNMSDAFVTAAKDGQIHLWDAGDYSVQARGSFQTKSTGEPLSLCFLAPVVFSGWTDGKIRAQNAEAGGGAPMATLWTMDECHSGGVTAMATSHNNRFIVSGGMRGEVRVWEIRSREMIRHLKQHTMAVTSISVASNDSEAVSASRDKTIVIWDLIKGCRRASLTQRMGGLWGVAVHPKNASEIVSVGQDQHLNFWNIENPNQTPTPVQSLSPGAEQLCVACSHNGVLVACAGEDCKVHVYDLASAKEVACNVGHSGYARAPPPPPPSPPPPHARAQAKPAPRAAGAALAGTSVRSTSRPTTSSSSPSATTVT